LNEAVSTGAVSSSSKGSDLRLWLGILNWSRCGSGGTWKGRRERWDHLLNKRAIETRHESGCYHLSDSNSTSLLLKGSSPHTSRSTTTQNRNPIVVQLNYLKIVGIQLLEAWGNVIYALFESPIME
jgi:hypothetical protein